mmetsp:Transcript_94937/g.163795  ORF Transcript_94937/g.163795 Transcript_94937/m.163795 type:complete len:241 (+) Transcript_94937:14356-15078(+)
MAKALSIAVAHAWTRHTAISTSPAHLAGTFSRTQTTIIACTMSSAGDLWTAAVLYCCTLRIDGSVTENHADTLLHTTQAIECWHAIASSVALCTVVAEAVARANSRHCIIPGAFILTVKAEHVKEASAFPVTSTSSRAETHKRAIAALAFTIFPVVRPLALVADVPSPEPGVGATVTAAQTRATSAVITHSMSTAGHVGAGGAFKLALESPPTRFTGAQASSIASPVAGPMPGTDQILAG